MLPENLHGANSIRYIKKKKKDYCYQSINRIGKKDLAVNQFTLNTKLALCKNHLKVLNVQNVLQKKKSCKE